MNSPPRLLRLSLALGASACLLASCRPDAGGSGDPGSDGGGGRGAPGAPDPACTLDPECLAVAHDAGAGALDLRVAELVVVRPAALARGSLGTILEYTFGQDAPACGVDGTGRSSWLLRIDLAARALTMGGARPPRDPACGYAFLDAVVTQGGRAFHVEPVTVALTPLADGSFTTAGARTLAFPMFFPPVSGDTLAGDPTVIPLHGVRVSGTVSRSGDCIGSYLAPADGSSSPARPAFHHGGRIQAFIALEEADLVESTGFGRTLCAMLAGDAESDGARPMSRCKRVSGHIAFAGDWCAATDGPAGGSCSDAVEIAADFAAGAVKIDD